MPTLKFELVWVLVRPDGSEEILETPKQFQTACALLQDHPEQVQDMQQRRRMTSSAA